MSILDKYLKKLKSSYSELTVEEQQTYDTWKSILAIDDRVSVESILNFCKNQINVIENKLARGETQNDSFLKACLHVYLNLSRAIEAPKVERERLEKHLESLLDKLDPK